MVKQVYCKIPICGILFLFNVSLFLLLTHLHFKEVLLALSIDDRALDFLEKQVWFFGTFLKRKRLKAWQNFFKTNYFQAR